MRNRGSGVEDKIENEIMYPIIYRGHVRVSVLIGNRDSKGDKMRRRSLPQAVQNTRGDLIGSVTDETNQQQRGQPHQLVLEDTQTRGDQDRRAQEKPRVSSR